MSIFVWSLLLYAEVCDEPYVSNDYIQLEITWDNFNV